MPPMGNMAGAKMYGDEMSASRMTEEMAAPPDRGGWKVEDVSIKQAANGGFIVRCSKRRAAPEGRGGMGGKMPMSESYRSDEYAFGGLDEAMGFVRQEFGGAPLEPAPAMGGEPDDVLTD